MSRLDAAAAAICERRNAPDWPCNGLDFDVELARVALAAAQLADCPDPQSDIERYRAQMAPLLAELGRLRAMVSAVATPTPFGAKEPTEELADLRAELANARGWLLWIEQTHPGLTAMWRRGDAAP